MLYRFKSLAIGLFGFLVAITISSCHSDSNKLFTRLGDDTGITFINTNTETQTDNILSYEYFYNGGGVAAGDINNDGLTDLYFTANNGENKLYLNEGNFRFRDITESSGTAAPSGWKTGASMVDINGDGLLDIYVCRSKSNLSYERMNLLFINKGDLTFQESAFSKKLNDPSYSTQAAFFDYDRDGDLDAFLLNHSLLSISNSYNISQKNSRKRHPLTGNKLLRNDNGTFVDVSDSVGVYGPASNYGLGVSLSDINNDGWIDIYAGCDYTGRDRVLLNIKGKFIDATDSLLSHISKFTMGTDIADINNDGWMDIYTVDMLPEDNYRQKQLQGSDRYDEYMAMAKNGLHYQCMRNMLHLNNGDGTFSEVGQLMNVSNTDWSWSSLFADFDNDGVQDLFVTNGFKRDLTNNDFARFQASKELIDARKRGETPDVVNTINKFTENKIANYIFKGHLDSGFVNVREEWGLDEPSLSNGAVYADLDNDGDLDLVVNNINENAAIYRNNAEKLSNSFLKIKLEGDAANRMGIGSRVDVYCQGKRFVREQFPVRGFQSSIDPILHFGIGSHRQIDSVIVRWPDGSKQVVSKPVAGQLLVIRKEVTRKEMLSASTIFSKSNAIPFTHKENDFVDFRVQPLLPRMYSRNGPAFAKGDVNADGLADFYIGGAAGQSAQLWLATTNGKFRQVNVALFEEDKASEDIDALFVDVDGDKDQDLYVVTGGYEITDKALLLDRLYLNNGNGAFTRGTPPEMTTNGSCVRSADFDGDSKPDLFIGGSVTHARYPEADPSFLLRNEGGGNFSVVHNIPPGLLNAGIVSDATWTDVNGDSETDLILVGEWSPIRVFINKNGKLTDKSREMVGDTTSGLWTCILSHDFDNDGDKDFVVGNVGLNDQMKASRSKPVAVYYDDFDNNGSIDPLLTYYIGEKSFPYASRDELAEQLPSFKKRFTNYDAYSNATIENVLTGTELEKARRLQVMEMASCYFENTNGKLAMRRMPIELQRAPLTAMALMDVNQDGIQDLLTGGNWSTGRARTGKMTGNYGSVFLSDGKGNFRFVPPSTTGIAIHSDVRKIVVDQKQVYFGSNNSPLASYQLR
jgi:enediyne biosynthesis protein E4